MTTFALCVMLQAVAMGADGQPPADNYTAAYNESLQTGQPLVVLVGTEWCYGCRVMKTGVLPNLVRRGALRNVKFSTVNADDQPVLARRLMRGESIPQLIVFTQTKDGWQREAVVGSKPEEEVEKLIERAVAMRAEAPKADEESNTSTTTVNR